MPTARLGDRGVVGVSGEEARGFLDRLVTCATDAAPGRARFGALLTPQGKILVDFVLHAADESGTTFRLDCPAALAPDLVRRLSLYRLRAKLAIVDFSATHEVVVGWGGEAMPANGEDTLAAPDPRRPELGWRAIRPRTGDPGTTGYEDHRIGCAVPEGGRDFAWGDAFPHEALMDQLGGVAFDKGCYVGQEVVSRMQHRGTARTRILPVLWDGEAPDGGTAIVAGDKPVGSAGSSSGRRGLATLRLDRVADAIAAGTPMAADGRPVTLGPKPDWVRFAWPGDPA